MIGHAPIRRRCFLAAGAGATFAARGVAAQPQGKQSRLAILAQGDKASLMRLRPWTAFFEELRRLGYDEGQNLLVAWYSTEGDDRQVSELAGQIVRTRPDLVFTPDLRMAAVLKAATNAIPVIAITDDPVFRGFAANLARPGGNITGIAVGAGSIPDLAAKRASLLKEAVPTVSKLALLVPRRLWDGRFAKEFGEVAQLAGITIVGAVLEAPADEAEYRRVFAAAIGDGADGLLVGAAFENCAPGDHRQPCDRIEIADVLRLQGKRGGRRAHGLWDGSRRCLSPLGRLHRSLF